MASRYVLDDIVWDELAGMDWINAEAEVGEEDDDPEGGFLQENHPGRLRSICSQYQPADRERSAFWLKYVGPALHDPQARIRDDSSREGIVFRWRFRVPYSIFEYITEVECICFVFNLYFILYIKKQEFLTFFYFYTGYKTSSWAA